MVFMENIFLQVTQVQVKDAHWLHFQILSLHLLDGAAHLVGGRVLRGVDDGIDEVSEQLGGQFNRNNFSFNLYQILNIFWAQRILSQNF